MKERVSHHELESCRANPEGWLAEKRAGAKAIFSYGYARATRDSIVRLHRAVPAVPKASEVAAARDELAEWFKANKKLTNEARKEAALQAFEQYWSWVKAEKLVVLEARVDLLDTFGSELGFTARVARIDRAAGVHRGVFLAKYEKGWRSELRFPLIQQAIANRYHVPIDEVAVGCQRLDGSGLQIECFEAGAVRESVAEFHALSRRIERLMENE